MSAPCKHYWMLVGSKGRRHWFAKHALVHCVHCGAWSVTEYGENPGPCGHVVGTVPLPEGVDPGVPVRFEEEDDGEGF